MRIYKILTVFTIIISAIALAIAILLHYLIPCKESEFWINILVGIFGSSVLTTLTSIVSYHYERRKILRSFLYHTAGLVKFLNKYQEDFSLEKKVQFYLDYHDLDKHMWDEDYQDIDFFFDMKIQNKKYIYNNIYTPINDFNNAVSKYVWNFRWHLDGSGKNDVVMKKYVEKLETYLIEKIEAEVPIEYDENDVPTSFSKITSISPKLSKNINKELYGRYYIIMYGKKAKKQFMEDESNEQNENADSK